MPFLDAPAQKTIEYVDFWASFIKIEHNASINISVSSAPKDCV